MQNGALVISLTSIFILAIFGTFSGTAKAAYPERPITYVIAFNQAENRTYSRAQQPHQKKFSERGNYNL